MPSDALHYSYLAKELNENLSDGRIEKIAMPEKDEIVLGIRARGKNVSLLISASASSARCHLTEHKKENPTVAPSFLMHLRKHIGGAKIVGVDCPHCERIIRIKLLTRNELSDEIGKTLIAELMGKYSNIILVNSDGVISECIKHVGLDTSSKRQVLPGLKYESAPSQNKCDPTDTEQAEAALLRFPGGDLDSYMIHSFLGLAPVSVREALFDAAQPLNCPPLHPLQAEAIARQLDELFTGETHPCLQGGDFFVRPYRHIEKPPVFFPTLSLAMDEHFLAKDRSVRFNEKSKRLQAVLKNAASRAQKRLDGFISKKESCHDAESDKLCGELITANIYRIKKGSETVTLENWYDDNRPVEIALDSRKSPQANAQDYFKRYNKKKKTLAQIEPLIEKTRDEIEYYKSIEPAFSLCTENSEIAELTEELERAGLIEKKRQKVKQPPIKSSPLTFFIDGFTVRVGKNNMQNDSLTKSAKGDDVWLHTKSIHGSHVIISAERRPVPENVILKAAALAAGYSKAGLSHNVPVDYTLVKYVNKPSGAPPGKVIYTHQNTVYVDPIQQL